MKKMYYLSILAMVVSMLIACQEEISDATQPSKSTATKSLRDGVDDCGCVNDYSESKVTFTFGTPQITVEIWNDATTVHYYLKRTDNGHIGNLKVGPTEREILPLGGGRDDEYEFVEPVANLTSCALQNIFVRVVGVGEKGEDLATNVPYKIVTLCPPVDPCTYTYDTGMGGTTAGKTTDKNKAWWFYYDSSKYVEQKIYAGQTKVAGNVKFIGGTYTIVLADGWSLKAGAKEPVKIQGYTSEPVPGRPAAGLFTTYKGDELTKNIGVFPYYVVHLDLQYCNLNVGE